MEKTISKCCEATIYYRQINGDGEALPHCSRCHNPCEKKKERKSNRGLSHDLSIDEKNSDRIRSRQEWYGKNPGQHN